MSGTYVKELGMTQGTHQLPSALVEAMNTGKWPLTVIPGSLFSSVHSIWSDMNIELLKDSNEILCGGSQNADLETLIQFSTDTRLAERMRLLRGTRPHDERDLPWLDVDKALVVGGGADYGDDVWIVLDYRHDMLKPRVIFNVNDEDGRASWMVLAESIEVFLSRVTGKAWWRFW